MTCVVTAPCFNCKYTDCVVLCPVEAIFVEENVPAELKQDGT